MINWKEDKNFPGNYRGELSDHIHFTILTMHGHVLLQVPAYLNPTGTSLLNVPCETVDSAKQKAEEYCKDFKGEKSRGKLQ